MPSWFKKVFTNGEGRAPEPAPAAAAPSAPQATVTASAPAAPRPAPRPVGNQSFDFGDGRPKIRKVISAPVIVAEEERSSYSADIRIKAQVDRDGRTCRFMIDRPVFEGLSAWFPDKHWTQDASPLAEKLFGVEGVGAVLLHDTTVTITRAEGNNRGWKDMCTEIGGIIRAYLKSGDAVVTEAFRAGIPPEAEVRRRIQQVLDLEINPGIASHSGVVTLERVSGNSVYLTMGGGCQGCAASSITLRQGIHTAFRRAVPEVGAIYDETDHKSGSNPYFKELPAGMMG
jgi:Fe-S cluster biogenesis protein NfuA